MTYNANNIFPQKDVKDMQKLNVWNNNILESLNYNGLKEITGIFSVAPGFECI